MLIDAARAALRQAAAAAAPHRLLRTHRRHRRHRPRPRPGLHLPRLRRPGRAVRPRPRRPAPARAHRRAQPQPQIPQVPPAQDRGPVALPHAPIPVRRRHRPRVDQPPRPPPGRRGRHPARLLISAARCGEPQQLHVGGAGLEPEVDEARALGHPARRDVGGTGAHDQVGAGRDQRRQRACRRRAADRRCRGPAPRARAGSTRSARPRPPSRGGGRLPCPAVTRSPSDASGAGSPVEPPRPRHEHRPEAEPVGASQCSSDRDEELGGRGEVGVGELGVVHVRARVAVHRQHARGVPRYRPAQQHAVAGVDPCGVGSRTVATSVSAMSCEVSHPRGDAASDRRVGAAPACAAGTAASTPRTPGARPCRCTRQVHRAVGRHARTRCAPHHHVGAAVDPTTGGILRAIG